MPVVILGLVSMDEDADDKTYHIDVCLLVHYRCRILTEHELKFALDLTLEQIFVTFDQLGKEDLLMLISVIPMLDC